jgi:ethanolamine ammonia-lyase small subunit
MSDKQSPVTANPWEALRQFTDARIALGRSGVSLPTDAHLAFQMAHAQARDTVHRGLDGLVLAEQLRAAWPGLPGSVFQLHSAAIDRNHYLQRPDLGRRLDLASREMLMRAAAPVEGTLEERLCDVAFVIADGLSALAIEQNAAPLLAALHPRMAGADWRIAPLCVVRQARVAIGDEIGQALGAKAVVVFVGERPGLSSPDSMGLYLTWMPRVGRTDASRNCISNVRPAGLAWEEAACKLHYLLTESRQRQLSGVDLKDETAPAATALNAGHGNFLLK